MQRMVTDLPAAPDIDYAELKQTLAACKNDKELFEAIVNAPFTYQLQVALMFLGIMVLLLVNKKTGTIDRIALSKTELAKGTTDVSVKRFEDIKIPVDYPHNVIAQAIKTGQPQGTADWKNLFAPALNSTEARLNQASGGIGYSAVYPLIGARDGGGALIFSYFQYPQEIRDMQRRFMEKYSQLVTAALKNNT